MIMPAEEPSCIIEAEYRWIYSDVYEAVYRYVYVYKLVALKRY